MPGAVKPIGNLNDLRFRHWGKEGSGLRWAYARCDTSERERGGVFSVMWNGRLEEEIGIGYSKFEFARDFKERCDWEGSTLTCAEPRRCLGGEKDAQWSGVMGPRQSGRTAG